MSSDYVGGTRIALDITDKNLLKSSAIKDILRKIRAECGKDVSLSTHILATDSVDWDSVVQYDPFFEGVACVDSVKTFSARVKRSRVLSGLDVADYILSKIPCTCLSLEQLVYFAYADYLCENRERLFEDHICASPYGPTIESVCKTYLPQDDFLHPDVGEMPAKSRILFAYTGREKLLSVNQTLDRYGGCTVQELVALTHRTGSPWSSVNSLAAYQSIADNTILERHHVECLP